MGVLSSSLASRALLLWAAVAGGAAGAQPALPAAAPQNVVSLSADAQTEVTQDMLSIVLATVREGSDAAAVQSQLRQALDQALVEARKAARAGQLEVRTGNFQVSPRWANPKPGQPAAIAGWQGRAELVLEGRDLAAISQLAGRLPGLTVSQMAFGLSREARERVEAELAAQAIARFRTRAERYAQAFGFSGYSVREVTVSGAESGPSAPVPMFRMARAAPMAAPADESQPAEAGRSLLTVTVSGSIQMSAR